MLCLRREGNGFGAARSLCLFLAFLFLAPDWGHALDPEVHISQYGHRAWRIQDGFFNGAPTAIAQTADGYLWVGTESGLFRFDGVRFVPWSDFAPQEPRLTAEVSALLGGHDGSLWIGAGYRFYRWKDGTLSQFSDYDGYVDPIIETQEGEIWLARQRIGANRGVLCQVQGQRLQCYGEREGVPLPYATSLAEDKSGRFWVGSSSELLCWHSDVSEVWTLKAMQRSEGLDGMLGLAVDRNQTVWVGLSRPGPGLGLEEFRDGVWKPFLSPELDGSKIAVSRLFLDRDGALWVGTDGQGIYRIVDGKVDHFDGTDGLTGDKVTAFFQDHEGTIWVATSKGIDSFRDLPIVTISKREGLHLDDARSILSATDGTIWIGNDQALDAWRNGVISSILPKDGLPGRQVTSLLQDPRGGLWVGIDTGLFHFDRGKFTPVIRPDGSNVVFAMTRGADGSSWVVSSGPAASKLIQIHDGHLKLWHAFPPGEAVRALATDAHGRIWIAGDKLGYLEKSRETTLTGSEPNYGSARNIAVDGDEFVWFGAAKGLIGYRDGKMRTMTVENGLPCERINTLIVDNHRSLWLYAQCGLIRINHGELENWWRHPDAHVTMTVFDALDGFQGGSSSFRPAATKSSDGRLWFVNYSVVQTVDPDHLYTNGLAPPIRIEQVIADTRTYSSEDSISFPKLTRNIEIRYAALSFVVPQRVRFRYKLDGYDTDWQEVGTRRSAFYTNLRPGTYKFQVTACNNSGLWNSRGTSLNFVILPAWYQTTWFRSLVVVLLILLGYVFYLVRMRRYATAMKARFSERLDERTRIARELHDTLLQSFHGLLFQFQAARNLLPRRTESAMQTLDKAILATEHALAEGRDAIRGLRPEPAEQQDLADLLSAAGQELAETEAANGHPPGFRVVVVGRPRTLSPPLQGEIYRIGREVIRNAFHHADASHIEAEVLYDEDHLRLRIRDDGKGIDRKDLQASGRPGHWGLPGIRERAQRIESQLEFWSEAGAGTEVELKVPAAVAYEKQRNGHHLWLFRRKGSHDERS
jgi:signal transduction histidine kinase/ligand-binding sensor domain-containing protein